jgi:hypothetical protein
MTDRTAYRHFAVGVGVESHWQRAPNRNPGCICPPWRYHPRHPKPTDPDCREHGGSETA